MRTKKRMEKLLGQKVKKQSLNVLSVTVALGMSNSFLSAAVAAPNVTHFAASPVHSSTVNQHTVVGNSHNNSTSSHANSTPSTSVINLAATTPALPAGSLGSFKALTINIGGKNEVVRSFSRLTPAEFVAAQQVLSGGGQTIRLNASGAATGGSVQLNASLLNSLDNAGGATLSSLTIPKQLTVNDSISSLSLSGSLYNYGTLTAKNDLTLSAGSVINQGTISASHNVSINSGSINNAGGTISAGNAINIKNAGDININGGNLLSQTLNLNAGNGAININGSNITGVVNQTGSASHINATSQNFLLGTSNISGDPLFSTPGNFIITSSISPTNGNDLSIVAGGNITASNNTVLNTVNNASGSGNLLLIAGANFTVDSSGNLTITQTTLPNGGTTTGGAINLTGVTEINTSSTSSSAGNVLMIAYGGTGAGAGSVTIPSTIKTGVDSPNVGAGNVTIFAGAKTGTGISLGNIDASGSGAAIVDLETTTPITSTGGYFIQSNGFHPPGGFFSANNPLAVNPANVSVSNINVNSGGAVGGQLTITTGGTLKFGVIDTSGYGGASVGIGALGKAGGQAGDVTLNAGGSVTGGSILSYGGGGSGGGGGTNAPNNGRNGGAGGSAGFVTVNTTSGSITLTGLIDTSGGGGGGGGGAGGTASTTKAGGTGGIAGTERPVVLSTQNGSVSVAQGIYAVAGAAGKNGGASVTAPVGTGGGGGGGGGSFGGGGGGGGAGAFTSGGTATGGGGGGGFVGGGGGDSSASSSSGAGGGAGIPGSGPLSSEPITLGAQFSGGSGVGTPDSGGTWGAGGLAGNGGPGSTGASGVNGNNVIIGTIPPGFSSVTISATTGIGSATAPQTVLSKSLDFSAPGGSLFVTSLASINVNTLLSSPTGTVTLSAMGNISLFAPVNASTLNLTTLNQSNGSIALNSQIAAGTINLNASGSGSITEGSISIDCNTITASSGTGSIALNSGPGNNVSNFQFNSSGAGVNFGNNQNLTLLASSDLGASSIINISTLNSKLTIGGAVTGGGTANFQGGTGIAVNSQVTAPGGLVYLAVAGTITGTNISNNGPLTLITTQGSLGTLTVNAPSVTVNSNAANITDSFTGFTSVTATGNQGFASFSFSSAASTLSLGVNAVTKFGSVTIKNTAANGSIQLDANAITAINAVNISTTTGSVVSIAPGSTIISAGTLNFTSTSGSFSGQGGVVMQVSVPTISIAAGSSSSLVVLLDATTAPITLQSVTANSFSLSTPNASNSNILITNKISAATINITDSFGSILQTSSAGLVSGNNVSLSAFGFIGQSFSAAGLSVSMSGANSLLSLNAGSNAEIQSTGAITLGPTTAGDLWVTSTAAVTQTQTLNTTFSAFISGASFTQAANSSITTQVLNVTATGGNVTIGGVISASLNTFFNTPGTGSLTVSAPAGNVLNTPTLTLQAGKNVTVSPTLNTTVGLNNSVNNETIIAGGTVSLPTANYSVGNNGNNGGTLAITGASLLVNGAPVNTPITLNASPVAASNGNGGSISVTLTGTTAVTVASTGATSGILAFNAPGLGTGTGGTIFLKNAGAISVPNTASGSGLTFAPAITGSDGGNLTLISGKTLSIVGTLDSLPGGVPGAHAGAITLGANGTSTQPFTIGAGGTPVNGSGTITGGNVTITNNSGITISVAGAITLQTSIQPTLILNTNLVNFAVNGSIVTPNSTELTIQSTGALSFTNVPSSGAPFGGFSSIVVNAGGNVTMPLALLGGHSISLTSTGTLTLPSNLQFNSIFAAADPITGDGGTIFVSAKAQNFSGNVQVPLFLVADAAGTTNGNGGSITYILTGSTPLVIGSAAGNNVQFDVRNGSVTSPSGGTIIVQNGGAISDPVDGIKTSANVNNNVSIASPGSTLLYTPDLSLLNIGQGNLSLQSNSSTTFTVGTLPSGTLNGASLSAQLTVGTLTIGNKGGGVALGQALTANPLAVPSGGFAANISAKTNITEAAADVLTAPSISLQSTSGNVGAAGAGNEFVISGSNAGGTSVAIGTGATGLANVKDTSVNGDILSSATTGANFTFNSSGSLQVQGTIAESTAINLQATGAFSEPLGNLSTKALTFSVATMTTPLLTNATTINTSSVTGAAGTNPTINIIDSTKSALNLGALSTTLASGTISVLSNGSITLTGNVGGGANVAGSTTLVAGGATGNISAGVNTIFGTSFLSLTSPAGLTGKTPTTALTVNAGGLLYLNSTGAVFIADSQANASPVTIQSLPNTVKSFTFSNAGPITLNNITSSGNILVSDTTTNQTGGITTNTGTQLLSTDSKAGTITLTSATNTTAGNAAMNLNGNVLAANVNLTSGTGGNITYSSSIGAGTSAGAATVTINAGGNATPGDLIQANTNGGTDIYAKTLTITAAKDIGTLATPVQTNATTINVSNGQTGTSGILITDFTSAPVTVPTALSDNNASAVISLNAVGNLTLSGSINAPSVFVAAGLSITFNGAATQTIGNLGPATNTNITAGNIFALPIGLVGGPASITTGAKTTIQGNIVNLTSNNGSIGGTTPATAVTTGAQGALNLAATGTANVINSSNSASTVNLTDNSHSLTLVNNSTAAGTLTINGVQSGGAVSITSNGGALITASPINAGGSVTLSAPGGTSASPTLGDVTLNAGVTTVGGSITVTSTDVLSTAASQSFQVIGGGNVIMTANQPSGAGPGVGGTVTLGANTTLSTTNTVAGSGNIQINGANSVTIGAGSQFSAGTVGNISVNAVAGAISILSSGTTTVLSANGGNGAGTVTLSAGNGLTVGDNTTINSGGNMNISAAKGGILLGSSSGLFGNILSTGNGNITITDPDTTAAGTFELGVGSSISTFANEPGTGTVTINLGTVGVANTLVTSSANVTVNGAPTPVTTATGFSAANPGVVLTGAGALITLGNFNAAAQFKLDASSHITADPRGPVVLPPSVPAQSPGTSQAGLWKSSSSSGSAGAFPGQLQSNGSQSSASSNSFELPSTNGLVNVSSSSSHAVGGFLSEALSDSRSGANAHGGLTLSSLNNLAGVGSAIPSTNNLLSSLASFDRLSSLQTLGIMESLDTASSIYQAPTNEKTSTLQGGVTLTGKPNAQAKMRGAKHSVSTKELNQGALLLVPEQATVVSTPFAIVQVDEKSVALVVCNDRSLSVYNLDDNHRDAISIQVNGETIYVQPGHHVTVASGSVDQFEQVNPAQFVGYRNLQARKLSSDLKVYHAEFNHLSMVAGLEPLRSMFKSSDPAKRKLGAHLLKTSSALSVMNKSDARFELMVAPAVTAMK